jgi:hypothetical protein
MSDRVAIATTMLIAGIMIGAFTVQLKDQLSLHLGTLGFNTIMQCSATGPWKNSPIYDVRPDQHSAYYCRRNRPGSDL